jgi:hypothetical protein
MWWIQERTAHPHIMLNRMSESYKAKRGEDSGDQEEMDRLAKKQVRDQAEEEK